jgi:hypothetical protein
MSILNRPSDGLVSVLLARYRGLLAYKPQSENALLDLVAPSSVVPDGKPDMARKTLTRWKQLGLFCVGADGTIALNPSIADLKPDDVPRFRAALVKLICAPDSNPALSMPGEQDGEGSGASDFTRAVAWVLAQDVYTFVPKWKDVEKLQSIQRVTPVPFVNDTRWGGFAEWSTFLGFSIRTPKLGLVPNPWIAIRDVLDEVFVDSVELAQADFSERIADILPVIDGGRYRMAIEGQIEQPWRVSSFNTFSPSFSAALLTLESSGLIRLENRSDAPSRLLLEREGRDFRSISHCVRTGAA